MKLVKFLKHASPYMAGETAGFPDARADQLIAKGIAVPAKAPTKDLLDVDPKKGDENKNK